MMKILPGNGFIPTSSLREILGALDDQLTTDQLNEMIAEIDTDDSGTVDFDARDAIAAIAPGIGRRIKDRVLIAQFVSDLGQHRRRAITDHREASPLHRQQSRRTENRHPGQRTLPTRLRHADPRQRQQQARPR